MHHSNSELKLKYKDHFHKISIFVNEFDPCGLIHGGAPEDEYDCLTGKLLSAAYANKSRNEIKNIIFHEIEHHFGTPDLTLLKEPYKTKFYNGTEILIDKIQIEIEKKL